MDDDGLKLGDVTLAFWVPPYPVAYREGEAHPIVMEVSARAGLFQGRIKGEGDVADVVRLYRVLVVLDTRVGQQADADFSLDLDYGEDGWLQMKFGLKPLGELVVDAVLGAGSDSETQLVCSTTLDQTWIRIWIRQLREIIARYLPAFEG
jgi:hypothetical protein